VCFGHTPDSYHDARAALTTELLAGRYPLGVLPEALLTEFAPASANLRGVMVLGVALSEDALQGSRLKSLWLTPRKPLIWLRVAGCLPSGP